MQGQSEESRKSITFKTISDGKETEPNGRNPPAILIVVQGSRAIASLLRMLRANWKRPIIREQQRWPEAKSWNVVDVRPSAMVLIYDQRWRRLEKVEAADAAGGKFFRSRRGGGQIGEQSLREKWKLNSNAL
uniref:Uncharacterized protein n=1 Tax=Trichuris muris TaxID=70415 RepID=A0A5S6QVD3_TRIMR